MDDKLREIIESKKDDREVAEFAGITLTLAEYDFLIEQAERLEELQLEVNDWRDEAIKRNKRFGESEVNHLETKELLHSTVSENKRYKQALERIIDFYPGVPNADFIPVEMLFEIKGIAYRALEANE